MIVELGVGFLAVGAAGYAIHRYREHVKWARIREKEVEWLERLKRETERGETKGLTREWLKREMEEGEMEGLKQPGIKARRGRAR